MAVRERYVNFYTDFAFKKLFGTAANKDLLMAFLNALFDGTGGDCLHHEVQLVEKRTQQVFFDKLTYIYLEMPKFTKTERELETVFAAS